MANFTGYFQGKTSPLIGNLTSSYSIEFFFGMIAAILARQIVPKSGYFFLGLGALLFLIFGFAENMQLFNGYAPPARIYYGLSSMLIVIGLANTPLKASGLNQFLSLVGSASYSIYLTHFIFIGVIFKIMERTDLFEKSPVILTFALFVVAAMAGGILLSKFIEYPVMRWLNQIAFKSSPK